MLVLVGLIKHNKKYCSGVSAHLAACLCFCSASLCNPSGLISEVIALGELASLPSQELDAFPVAFAAPAF